MLLDANFFKKINDIFGHNQGDYVLIEMSKIITLSVRSADIVGRWGGEEFLAICPGSSQDGVQRVAEKVRCSIEAFNFKGMDSKVTVSIGASTFTLGESVQSLIERVDKALYQAKEQGRNQVVFLGDES